MTRRLSPKNLRRLCRCRYPSIPSISVRSLLLPACDRWCGFAKRLKHNSIRLLSRASCTRREDYGKMRQAKCGMARDGAERGPGIAGPIKGGGMPGGDAFELDR